MAALQDLDDAKWWQPCAVEASHPLCTGVDDQVFSVEVHHGGLFVGHGENRAYIDGKINWFDYCEVDTWSLLWIEDFLEMLGYPKLSNVKVYWLLPEKTLSDGLRIISTDTETRFMTSVVQKFKNYVLYFDHDDNVVGINWDDIAANPVAELPKITSPRKHAKLPEFYVDIPKAAQEEEHGLADAPEDTSSEDDPDFIDSDNDISADDDDLIIEDELSDDDIVPKKDKAGSSSRITEDENDMSTDDEDLNLPESDDESQVKFKSFVPRDMSNPIFKAGLLFETVDLLRKAVTEYSIRERVEIKLLRNERKRYHAVCAPGCPWNLYASVDSRSNGMVIKRYVGQHLCQKKWVIPRCTSRWLSEKYLESFQADQNMTLTNFARVVQKELNVTPSRSKLARARRLAMKKVHGDESDQYKYLWDYAQEIRRSNPGSSFFLKLHGRRS